MKIYSADVLGAPNNCVYPRARVVSSAEELRRAVAHDYVCAEYRDSRRSVEAFIASDCLPMDVDNDHSDRMEDWISPADLLRLFPDVTVAIHYSRNHMKQKGDRSPRPRFHAIFAINLCKDVGRYRALKERLYTLCPFFDGNALDAARFMYGTATPEVMWVPGSRTLDQYLTEQAEEDAFARLPVSDDTIPEGKRNSVLSVYAGKLLKRFGDTEEARSRFLARAAMCVPPLKDQELKAIWRSAGKFYEKIRRIGSYVPPEQYARRRMTLALRPDLLTDRGEAEVLVAEYGDCLRYSPATQFMMYRNGVWQENNEMPQQLLDRLIDRQLAELKPLLNSPEMGPEEREYHRFLLSCTNHNRSTSVMNKVRHLVPIDVADLDSHPYLLNTPAGEVDLRTGKMTPHNPAHYHTHMTAVAPDRRNMDKWLKHLEEITCGDAELARYFQLTSGEALFGTVRNEYLQIEVGSGSNGKSTYTNTRLRVLGSYGGQISSETLTQQNRFVKNWEIGELRGKRFVVAGELEEGQQLSGAFLKKLCSTDPIIGEKKRKDPFTFLPSYSVVLYTNYLPRVSSRDYGTWRRLKVIPFNAVLRGEGPYRNYTEYLVSECGGAVLQWMIDGAKDVFEANFQIEEPACVRKAIAEYRKENDWLRGFIEQCCEQDADAKCRSSELYERYREYAFVIGERARNIADFSRALADSGYEKKHRKDGAYVFGLRIRPDRSIPFSSSPESDFGDGGYGE